MKIENTIPCITSRDSRVDIEFPWAQPDKPEYVFVPNKEFPNEELN